MTPSDEIPSAPYLHGTAPEEQARLSRLNDLLNAASLRELALHGGETILDVGSGLAQFTRLMAQTAGIRAVGIERSPEQIAEAQRQSAEANEAEQIELRQGDALNFPLHESEWGTFDLVHTRFLLEHVPDPLAVVQNMVRAAKPGGRIVLEDDAHDVIRLWPEPPGFTPLWNAYLRSFDRLGCDPHVGHRLVALLHQAGAAPVRNTWVFFGSCAGHPDFDAYVENLIGILEGARPVIEKNELLPADAFDPAITALRQWKHRPDAALWFPMAWAEGKK